MANPVFLPLVPGMTRVEITRPDGTGEVYDTVCPFDAYLQIVDQHDMHHWYDENTGMLPRSAPAFHDITRGPLWDEDVRRACDFFSRVTLWDCDTAQHGNVRVYVGGNHA